MTAPLTALAFGPPGAPGVLLLHPWWGVTPAVVGWAQALAGAGRRVLVPDLYDGRVVETVTGSIPEAEALADALEHATVLSRLAPLADELAATGAPWAAEGFSLGGFLASSLGAGGTAAPAELVLVYGGHPPVPGTAVPHHVEVHAADADPWFTDDELADVAAGYRAAGADVVVHRYPGCGHWFAEDGSPGYDAAGAALARQRVLARLTAP